MLGFFGIPGLRDTPAQREERKKRKKAERDRRFAAAVPWDPKLKWNQEWNIKADTYKVRNLFPDVTPTEHHHIDAVKDPAEKVLSPEGTFVYVVKRLEAGTQLDTLYSNQQGTVMFDGPVLVPCLHEKHGYHENRWNKNPWMSLTPMEFVTLRAGIRFAKKHTVIAGLGLGHQLIEVSLKKTVKQITLIEKSQELVDWLLPRIREFMGDVPLKVVVDDAKKVVPKMTADVALIDIFRSYGGNYFQECPKIGRVWCWGSAEIGDGEGYW